MSFYAVQKSGLLERIETSWHSYLTAMLNQN